MNPGQQSHSINEGPEIQRVQVTCPRLHSEGLAEFKLEYAFVHTSAGL